MGGQHEDKNSGNFGLQNLNTNMREINTKNDFRKQKMTKGQR